MTKFKIPTILATLSMVAPIQSMGSEHDAISKALSDGNSTLNLRYRYEFVDQDKAFDKSANASTLKTRLTYQSAEYRSSSITLEFDNLTVIGNDNYNSTLNSKGQYPTVADPVYTEINQAYLDYKPEQNTVIRYGRQRILLDNQRFIGGVGWRQNEQTFDALTVINKSLADTTLMYSTINNINTITGSNDNISGTDLLHVNYSGLPMVDLAGYGYLIENKSDTYGVRVTSKKNSEEPVFFALEYAQQSGDGATDYDAGYYLAEVGGKFDQVKAWFGYEVQESDDSKAAFSTPLGTNHAFGGWSDQMLGVHKNTTNGLEDIYVGASTKLAEYKIKAVYHEFAANEGAADDYGSEINLSVSRALCDNVDVLVKYADYSKGDDAGTDTQKFWLQLMAKF